MVDPPQMEAVAADETADFVAAEHGFVVPHKGWKAAAAAVLDYYLSRMGGLAARQTLAVTGRIDYLEVELTEARYMETVREAR